MLQLYLLIKKVILSDDTLGYTLVEVESDNGLKANEKRVALA